MPKVVMLPNLTSKAVRVRAYDCFVRDAYDKQAEGLPMLEKMRLAQAAWKCVSPLQKAAYEANAQAQNDARSAERITFLALCDSGRSGRTGRSHKAERSESARAVANTLSDMRLHPIYGAGAGVGCFESGLRQELVTEKTDKMVREECKRLFGFDHQAVENPKMKMSPFVVCGLRCGGLCSKDELVGFGVNLTKSLRGHCRGGYQAANALAVGDQLCSRRS